MMARRGGVISVSIDPDAGYPDIDDHCPTTSFPEYPFSGAQAGGNRAYDLVRRCLRESGADEEHYGAADWNPLGQWIARGSRVFVLPNFVVDRRPNEALQDFFGKCTHGSVVRPVLDYATIATGDPTLVSFGNASLQSCDYERVTAQTGASSVAEFYRRWTGADVGPIDLRAVVSSWTRYGALLERHEQHVDDVVLIDLGRESLLDGLYDGRSTVDFRVSDYDHREMAEYHGPGRHVYAINRRVLEANTIVSVPKLKTHEKVGLTCVLKGTVGTIARKECLAHHRKGGPTWGGDEYPKSSALHDVASRLAERVTTMSNGVAANVVRVGSKVLYRALRLGPHGIMAGAWYGNDTAWRMTLDIARILRFARPDGSLADQPQREHVAFVDGIIGGEGEGPVYPTGVRSGAVIFGSDPVWTDIAASHLIRFQPASIALLATATRVNSYPLTSLTAAQVEIRLNGERATMASLEQALARGFAPPKGWLHHV